MVISLKNNNIIKISGGSRETNAELSEIIRNITNANNNNNATNDTNFNNFTNFVNFNILDGFRIEIINDTDRMI